MIQVLLAVIFLPVILVLLVIFGGALWADIRQSPMIYWTLVGFVVVFTPVFIIATWNELKRKRQRRAEEAAGKTVAQS